MSDHSHAAPAPPAQTTAPAADTGSTAAPAPITLSDDAVILPPGAKEPIAWKQFIAGYVPKADYTRGRQEFAREREAFERQKQEWERQRQQAEALLLERLRQIQQPATSGSGTGSALLDKLKSLDYLDGQTAATILETLRDEGFGPLVKAIQERDQALALMARQLQALHQQLGQLQETHQQGRVDRVIRQAAEQLGLPADDEAVREFLYDLYAAYEGEDLDQEFPNLVRQRWEGLRKAWDALQKQRAEQAKAALGQAKGGTAAATKPLGDKLAKLPAADLADELWNLIPRGEEAVEG